jgi:hypothetical protein
MSNAVQVGTAFLCMVPDGPSVDPKAFSDGREWNRTDMFCPQDLTGGIALLAKRQTRFERGVFKSKSRRQRCWPNISGSVRDLGPNAIDEAEMN